MRRSGWTVQFGALRRIGVSVLISVLAGCATTSTSRGDPLEGFNRAVFSFNEALDIAILKPVATGYQAVLPEMVRTGVDNFFDNLVDAWSAVNHLLQGKPVEATEMGVRFGMNTFIGLGGLIDVATDAGLGAAANFGRRSVAGVSDPVPTSCCRCWARRPARQPLVLDWRATPVAMLHESRDRVPLAVLQIISTRADCYR
jgi:phospholipid-binding lipoprotein MlaA